MTQPLETTKAKSPATQTQTLIVNEGIHTAILITNRSGQMKESTRRFPSPELALAWCRAKAVKMIYLPTAWVMN